MKLIKESKGRVIETRVYDSGEYIVKDRKVEGEKGPFISCTPKNPLMPTAMIEEAGSFITFPGGMHSFQDIPDYISALQELQEIEKELTKPSE